MFFEKLPNLVKGDVMGNWAYFICRQILNSAWICMSHSLDRAEFNIRPVLASSVGHARGVSLGVGRLRIGQTTVYVLPYVHDF